MWRLAGQALLGHQRRPPSDPEPELHDWLAGVTELRPLTASDGTAGDRLITVLERQRTREKKSAMTLLASMAPSADPKPGAYQVWPAPVIACS